MIIFEFIYKLIIRLRNFLYDIKLIKPYNSKSYVISIGNIIAGGTGKTPLIIYIAQYLINSGYKVGIVAGGYKRNSKGLLIVHDKEKISTSVERAGDEAYLIAEKLNVPVLIHDKKYLALKKMDRLFDMDIVMIDDGFQHRKIKRDLDIVIINDRTIEETKLIPRGYLREEKSNLNRADILIYRDLDNVIDEYKSIISFHLKSNINPQNINAEKACVLTAIANPTNFVNFLNNKNANIEKVFAYKDHHFFKQSDIDEIIDYCKSNDIYRIYTTEKDKVKLNDFELKFNSNNIELVCIDLEIIFENEILFKKHLIGRINEKISSN